MEKQQLQSDKVFLINNFFSPKECEELIIRSEDVGFGAAPVTTFDGPQLLPDVRSNTRVMVDDPELAALIYERARPFLPTILGNRWHL